MRLTYKHCLFAFCIAFLALTILGQTPIFSQELSPREQLYQGVKSQVVEILVDGHLSGSGCFVNAEGLILTAAHVVAKPTREVEVLSTSGRLPAKIVAVDPGHDLILLQVSSPKEGGFNFSPIAEKTPPVGEDVYIFGTPLYRHALLQKGMIARDKTTYEYQDHWVRGVQIANSGQPGTSGSPWYNIRGEVFAVQSGTITNGSVTAGVSNASPLDAIKALIASRKNTSTSMLGIFVDEVWVLQPGTLKKYPKRIEGVVVQDVKKGSPAAHIGLKKGDIIVRVDDKRFSYREHFIDMMRAKKPGDEIRLHIIRPNEPDELIFVPRLGELEAKWKRGG